MGFNAQTTTFLKVHRKGELVIIVKHLFSSDMTIYVWMGEDAVAVWIDTKMSE